MRNSGTILHKIVFVVQRKINFVLQVCRRVIIKKRDKREVIQRTATWYVEG
jgi:hypothetical protein